MKSQRITTRVLLTAAALCLGLTIMLPDAPQAQPKPKSGGGFQAMDADGDGRVSAREYDQAHPASRSRSFMALDHDGDGFIQLREWESGSRGMGQGHMGQGHMGQGRMGQGHMGQEMMAPEGGRRDQRGATRSFSMMDGDGDGAISQSEYDSWFTRMDVDGNGKIDEREWTATHGGSLPRTR